MTCQRIGSRFSAWCKWLSVGLLLLTMQLARSQTPAPAAKVEESELTKAEKDLATRLVELNKTKEAEGEKQKAVAQAKLNLEKAKLSNHPKLIDDAKMAVKNAQEALQRATEAVKAAQKLHDQAREKFMVEKQKAELAAEKKAAPPEKSATPIDEAVHKKLKVDQAQLEAALAEKKTNILRQQLELLLLRRTEIRESLDEIQRKLSWAQLPEGDRPKLMQEQASLTQESRRVSDQIQKVREELLLAEAHERVKKELADEESAGFQSWKQQVYIAAAFVVTIFVAVVGMRLMFVRRIRDPGRRYYIKKSLSLIMIGVVVIGLVFIFANRFTNLLTMLGLALAGITIALQDLVASFVAWFHIRGSRTYRTGDWIQLGELCGEVIDIGFLRTTVQQVEPFASDTGHRGGNLTGGIGTFMNNVVFKQNLVNHTRSFPFIWCSLRYNVAFESNWIKARERIQQLLTEELEIVGTAERAKDKMRDLAEDYSIKTSTTDPVVLTWTSPIGVEFTVWFLAHPRRRVALIDKINRNVLKAIQEMDDATFAYHTIRSIPTPPPERLPGPDARANGEQTGILGKSEK